MATPSEEMAPKTWRRYEDGNGNDPIEDFTKEIFDASWTHKCPTYVHKTPPCQGGCPSGEDIRGWLAVVRGQELPPEGTTMEEYAFQRSTDANPFPSMMGRVCPAPCEDSCNRNDVEDFVGINSVEQFIGDTALEEGYKFSCGPIGTQKVAIIGAGPAGMAAAYQLRRKGYATTVFESQAELGGMMRYGIPNYRVPRDKLAAEMQRIIDMGDIEIRTNTRIGKDVSVEQLEKDYDAILWAIGCWTGRDLPATGWEEASNCVSGVAFLKAFNEGRMKVTGKKVVCIGGGDTSIDVVSVTRRIGSNAAAGNPEDVVLSDDMDQDQALSDASEAADATLTSLFTKDKMMAAEHEIHDALHEGVEILDGVMPLEMIVVDGRATGMKVADCKMDGNAPTPVEGTERIIEGDLFVAAIGQGGDLTGVEEFDNGRGLIDADNFYQVKGKAKHFAAGDIIRPHLLTTAIGHASVAADTIESFFNNEELRKRKKVDVHHFDLADKMDEAGLSTDAFVVEDRNDMRGTDDGNWAVHNYEDRSFAEIIPSDELFLGHFQDTPRLLRSEEVPSSADVLGHFQERMSGLEADAAKDEAERCMSCGMCFECDNCVIFCPQDAVFRVKKNEKTTGRYVDTDYDKCIGCHICADVCPTGYIKMGLGE